MPPLTLLTWSIEYKLWGLNPIPYNVDSLILHLLNIILIFYFILKLCKRLEVATIVALLFAIHPMNVSSFAWSSQRTNLLYAFFYFLSLISYLYYLQNNYKFNSSYYAFIFYLAILSKVWLLHYL